MDIDFDKIRKNVNDSIDILEITHKNLKGPLAEQIKTDLIAPALVLLARFCACVEVHDEETP